MDNIKDTHGSGENDADDKDKALREYRVLYGHDFNLEDCWKVLRNHTAWKKEMPAFQSNSRKKTKGSTTTSGSTQGPMNFQDVDDSDDDVQTRESRPEGRDAARKKSSSSSRDPPESFVRSLAKTFFKFKPSKSGKNKDTEEAYLKLKEKELEMKREKIELQRQQVQIMTQSKREQDLIFYNLPIDQNLPARQRQELLDIKAAIKARYSLDY